MNDQKYFLPAIHRRGFLLTLGVGTFAIWTANTAFGQKVFDVVPGIRTLDDRDKYQRTTSMYVQNDTPAAIKICFLQATCRYDLPPPYYKDTGSFIAGVDQPNGASIAIDPWDVGGRHAPIAATAGNGTCKLTYQGNETDLTLKPYAEAPEGQFYPQLGWVLKVESSPSVAGGRVDIFVATPILAGTRPITR
ncbi:hypothetical protein ABIB00_005445 [Bradyrhizobium sp. LB14.3]|uniref:hypothetical protein n=1 Tax=Bradyrhizobium sp. LB14.3 TaxID=3156328 RepID=UPI003395889F